ncbi:Dsp1, partial [Symbiodinium sp. CCMP2592]
LLAAFAFATSSGLRLCQVTPLTPPKRPLSAWMLWLGDHRQSIRDSLPAEAPNTETLKEAGRRWQSLEKADKEKYEKLASDAKEAYLKDVQDFAAAGGVMPGAKPRRDPAIPKKPLTSYMLFVRDHRQEIKDSLPLDGPAGHLFVEAGKRWRALDDSAREQYKARAEQLKAAYLKEMKDFLAKGGVITETKRQARTRAKKVTGKDPLEPKKPQTAWKLWLRENREQILEKLRYAKLCASHFA